MNRTFRRFSLALFCSTTLAALTACGGGGGGAGSAPDNTAYAVRAALHNMRISTKSWTGLTGVGSDGRSYTLAFSQEPLPGSVVFPLNGQASSGLSQSASVTVAGSTTTTSGTVYFNGSDASIGTQISDGTCTLTTASTPLPATAVIGTSGAADSDADYVGCVPGSAPSGATSTSTWSMESDGGVPQLCENSTQNDPGLLASTYKTCIEIAADGTLGNRARVAISDPNAPAFSLTARNY